MGPYTKTASKDVFDDGWEISEGGGHVIAHVETESLADVLMHHLSGDSRTEFEAGKPYGEAEIAYHYLDGENNPLLKCPHCAADLTAPQGVALDLVVDGREMTTTSRLDDYGQLEDTEDGAVAKGFHGETRCDRCGGSLVDYEEVA